ncbi:MAG: protein kinase domain-containing protein [Gemmatimonadaceae bacterium]
MNRCPTCGTSYPPDARFCTRDGTKLVDGAAPSLVDPTPRSAGRPVVPPPAPADATSVRQGVKPHTQTPVATPALAQGSLVGQRLDQRYEIERKLGEGGMASVWLGRDIASGERFAIKVLAAGLSTDHNAMARLRREASFGMRLAHPNICHIIRLGETEGGLVYVVMPFIAGEVLSDRTNKRGQLDLVETVRFVGDIAAGLHVAHQIKIVHRDLKPENVMVRRLPDGREQAVVMDFGLAKERRAGHELQKLTKTGIILGTPEFMSPEQLRGKPLDGRTDVYALALMTYEMLTGKLPFQGRNQQEVMIARLRGEPMPIRQARPDIRFAASVEAVLLKGMHRDPDQRFQTAPDFAQALAEAASPQPPAGGTPAGEGGGILGKLFGR